MQAHQQQQQDLNTTKAAAHAASLTTDRIIEVRQVTAQGFVYCERGATNEGCLIGAFRRGAMAW